MSSLEGVPEFLRELYDLRYEVRKLEERALNTPIGNNPLRRSRLQVKAKMIESRIDRAGSAICQHNDEEAWEHLRKARELKERIEP